MVGGRSIDALFDANFTRLDKIPNKSNRYKFECNHCTTVIENRDNALAVHLGDPRKCPQAPADVRTEALMLLQKKGLTLPTGNAQLAVKKRKRDATDGPLDGYVDHPLTEAQRHQADIYLLR